MGWVRYASEAVDAESQYPTIISVTAVVTVLAVLIVGLRLYIRHTSRGLASDDFMAALSMVFAVIYSSLCIAQTRFGLGLPIALRPKENLITYTEVNFAGRPIYQTGISFFKIALLISYLRLLKGTDQKLYRMIVWVIIVVVFLGHLACALALIFACTPVDKSWNPLKDGTCLPAGSSFTGYAVVTIVSDVLVALVPLPVLLKLNIPNSKKFGLIGIFALGLFTTICSIMRYLQINRIQYGDGNSTMLVLWGVIEFNVGNMVSSLPFLAPVFMRKAKEYRSKQSGGYSGSSGERSRSRGFRFKGQNDRYQLSNLSGGKDGMFSGSRTTEKSGSEENILKGNIVKSVTYSVQIDNVDKRGTAQRQAHLPVES